MECIGSLALARDKTCMHMHLTSRPTHNSAEVRAHCMYQHQHCPLGLARGTLQSALHATIFARMKLLPDCLFVQHNHRRPWAYEAYTSNSRTQESPKPTLVVSAGLCSLRHNHPYPTQQVTLNSKKSTAAVQYCRRRAMTRSTSAGQPKQTLALWAVSQHDTSLAWS